MQNRVLVVTGGIIAAALLLFACPGLAADSTGSDVDAGEVGALQKRVAASFVQTGRQHLEAGRVKEAAEDFTAALSFDSAQPGAREGLAAAQAKLGKAPARVEAAGGNADAEAKIVRAQASLRTQCESAGRMLARGEHAEAAKAYEKVLAAAKPLAGHADVAAVTAEANRGLKLAREGLVAKLAPKSTPAPDVAKSAAVAKQLIADNGYDIAMDAQMRAIKDMRIPQVEILKKPAVSALTMSRRHRVKDPATDFIGAGRYNDGDDEEAKKAIAAKLVVQRVTVSFKNQPFAAAIEYIHVASGVNILIDPAVLPSTVPVSGFSVSNMRLDHVLTNLLKFQPNLDYRIQDGAIYISNPEGLAEKGVTVLHDIADLTVTVKDFRGVGQSLGVLMRPDDESNHIRRMGIEKGEAPPVEVARDRRGQEWVKFIRENVRPSSWGGENGVAANTIAYRNGKLVVTHTAEVQEQIRELLSSFRKARAIQVAILARFIEVSENFLEDFGVQWSGGTVEDADAENPVDIGFARNTLHTNISGTITPGHEVGLGTAFADDSGLNMAIGFLNKFRVHLLINAVRKENQGNLLTAPRVTCFNTQRAFLTVSTIQSYVRSYNSDGFPEIGQVNDGIILEVQPFVSADRRYITLELIPQVNQVGDFQTFDYRNTPDDDDDIFDVTEVDRIQLPSVTTRQVMTTVSVPDGGTLMIGGLAKAREGRGKATVPVLGDLPLLKYLFTTRRRIDARENLIILVTAHIIQQDED